MKFRKWIATALALCMMLPTAAMAMDVETELEIVQLSTVCIENPMGAVMPENPMVISDITIESDALASDSSEVYATKAEAAKALLTGLQARESNINVNVSVELYEELGGATDSAAIFALYDAAFEHDISDPTGGDYAEFTMDQTTASGAYVTRNDEILYYILRYYPTYRTTAEEEAAMDAKVAELVTEWKSQGLSQYDTIQTIYDYITANVNYDNAGLNDATDVLKYTAYGALCEGSAVCMGISILFYRLALEMDVDARFIQSIDKENHAWNIVKLGDFYYNIDATWDLDEKEYDNDKWFLKNMADFQVDWDGSACHTRKDTYLTDEWNQAYPMATFSHVNRFGQGKEDDPGNIAISIKPATNWKADCTWSDGEYTEIDVPTSWISTSMSDPANYEYAKTLPIKMGMSWDEDYIYTYLEYEDPNGHNNTFGNNPYNMWLSGCVQAGFSDDGATGSNRMEYGITRTSDTNELISTVWSNRNDYVENSDPYTDWEPSTNDYNVQVNGNTVTYEFRTPISSFSNVAPEESVSYRVGYVLSWGNDRASAHTCIGSGISGWAGKQAANFMKVTLVGNTTAADLTGDGTIDTADLVLLQDYFSGNTADFDPTKADFNGDGVFTRADVMYLARALADWEGYKIG